MFMYAIVDSHGFAEAIATSEAKALIWVTKFLDKREYVLDGMTRAFAGAPITVRAHAKEGEELKIELLICKTKVVTP